MKLWIFKKKMNILKMSTICKKRGHFTNWRFSTCSRKMFNIYHAGSLYITVGHIRGTKLGNVYRSNFSNSRNFLFFETF